MSRSSAPATSCLRIKSSAPRTSRWTGVAIEGLTWLDEYDAYYYDRSASFRCRCCASGTHDPQHTWLYFDPRRGTIARKEERLTRLNRWLYHGLHSLDFPFLYYKRPLWDIVVMLLSIGGIVLERHDADRVVAAGEAVRYFGVAILNG